MAGFDEPLNLLFSKHCAIKVRNATRTQEQSVLLLKLISGWKSTNCNDAELASNSSWRDPKVICLSATSKAAYNFVCKVLSCGIETLMDIQPLEKTDPLSMLIHNDFFVQVTCDRCKRCAYYQGRANILMIHNMSTYVSV